MRPSVRWFTALAAAVCVLPGTSAPAAADVPDARADDGSHVVAQTTVDGDARVLDLTVRSTGVGAYAMVRLILPQNWAGGRWPAVYLLAGETRLQDYRGWSANTDVRRLADDAEIKLPRKQLRSGRLAPGTKVLALCKSENEPATIIDVPPAGRVARIQCDGGMQKEEPLASLRSRPDLLPRSR